MRVSWLTSVRMIPSRKREGVRDGVSRVRGRESTQLRAKSNTRNYKNQNPFENTANNSLDNSGKHMIYEVDFWCAIFCPNKEEGVRQTKRASHVHRQTAKGAWA